MAERAWRDAAITNQSRQPTAPPVAARRRRLERRLKRDEATAAAPVPFGAHVREALAERHP